MYFSTLTGTITHIENQKTSNGLDVVKMLLATGTENQPNRSMVCIEFFGKKAAMCTGLKAGHDVAASFTINSRQTQKGIFTTISGLDIGFLRRNPNYVHQPAPKPQPQPQPEQNDNGSEDLPF